MFELLVVQIKLWIGLHASFGHGLYYMRPKYFAALVLRNLVYAGEPIS